MSNEAQKKKWVRVDPTINIGELLSLLTILCVGVGLYFNHEYRIQKNTDHIKMVKAELERSEERALMYFTRIDNRLVRIEGKLDKKQDR